MSWCSHQELFYSEISNTLSPDCSICSWSMETTEQLIWSAITAVIKGHRKNKRASWGPERFWWGVQLYSRTLPVCVYCSHQAAVPNVCWTPTPPSFLLSSTHYSTESIFISKHSVFFSFLCFWGSAWSPDNHSGGAKASRVKLQRPLGTAQSTRIQPWMSLRTTPGHWGLTL